MNAPMTEEQKEAVAKQIAVRAATGVTLTIASGHASERLDRLATWWLGGFAAALALIISNMDRITPVITQKTLIAVTGWFFWASVFCLIQRYVAMVIASAAASGKEVFERQALFQKCDPAAYLAELRRATPFPLRFLTHGMYAAIERGEFAHTGTLLTRLMLWQGLFATAEIGMLLYILNRLVNAIG